MDINYFPGRIRLRDKMFRDEEIRSAALEIVSHFQADQKITYNEKTGSILVTYDAGKTDEEKFKSLSPVIDRYKMTLLTYSDRKKSDVLKMLGEIKEVLITN